MNPAFTLDSTYIHLRPDESALAMEGGPAFWQGIEERHDLDHGRLMGSTDQSRDWDHWAYLGNAGWSWDDVLPIFKRIEDFDRGASDLRGEDGPF